jgi:hypothetical protein
MLISSVLAADKLNTLTTGTYNANLEEGRVLLALAEVNSPMRPACPSRGSPSYSRDLLLFLRFKNLDLALAGVVDGLGQDAGGFLRSVEAQRIFGVDEIDSPQRFALQRVRLL